MVFTIDSGYTRKCKDSRGGVAEVYLFPFVNYANSLIITNGNILTTFPNTTIYKFYSNTTPNATENQEQDAGGKFFNQSIALDLQYYDDYENVSKLIKKDYRLIFKDNNGLYRIFGLYNGISTDSINYVTGAGKSEFNGFKMTFSTKEEKQSFFINNLSDAGFIEESFFRITEDGIFRILENNDFRILE
jgi:hypothetical protein